MAKRAVECFRAQTYPNKHLLIVNSGQGPAFEESDELSEPCFVGIDAMHIGEIRNHGNKYAASHYAESWKRADIFIHWDDDDWSHPNRIAEQVALLQASGKQAVGYREMLFWRTGYEFEGAKWETRQAWLYRDNRPNYIVGTSLCYWRKTWEAKPFNPKLPERRGATGEDTEWLRGLDTLGVNGFSDGTNAHGPRLIASIHGSNTMDYKGIEKAPETWTRVPEWDSYCRETMAL